MLHGKIAEDLDFKAPKLIPLCCNSI